MAKTSAENGKLSVTGNYPLVLDALKEKMDDGLSGAELISIIIQRKNKDGRMYTKYYAKRLISSCLNNNLIVRHNTRDHYFINNNPLPQKKSLLQRIFDTFRWNNE